MKWGFVISALLIVIAVFSFLLFLEARNIPWQDLPSETGDSKALVSYVGQGWAENSLNSSEIIFDVVVYNYGYVEAKNVEVSCGLYSGDSEGNFLSETPFLYASRNTGNVASTSYNEVEVYASKNALVDDYSLSVCELVSCDNCEILDERLK